MTESYTTIPSIFPVHLSIYLSIYLFVRLSHYDKLQNFTYSEISMTFTFVVRQTISLHAAFPAPAVKYYVRASIVRSTVQLLIAKIKCERDASTRTHECRLLRTLQYAQLPITYQQYCTQYCSSIWLLHRQLGLCLKSCIADLPIQSLHEVSRQFNLAASLPIRHLHKVSMMLPHSCPIRLLHRQFPNSASASILPCRFQERDRVFVFCSSKI